MRIQKSFLRLVAMAAFVGSACAGELDAQEKPKDAPMLTREQLSELAAVQKEYRQRGATTKPYVVDSVDWLACYWPDTTTDESLAGLPDSPIPCNFDLVNCRVTDACLKDLKRIKNLRVLKVGGGTRITEAGIKELAGLSQLTMLELGVKRVSADTVKELSRLENLTTLDLIFSTADDAAVKELLKFKKLDDLNLRETKVTSAGLKVLREHKSLTILRIGGPDVTDAWVSDIKTLDNLKILQLDASKVTDRGLAELRKALPKCYIAN